MLCWLRPRVGVVLAGAVLFLSCSSSEKHRDLVNPEQTTFPAEYKAWKKLNAAPIVLDQERESRDLYANDAALNRAPGAPFQRGAVLVKEQRVLSADPRGQLKPGELLRISVMFKVGGGQTSGWAWRAFDPQTHEEIPRDRIDPDGCYYCHADAAARDYVFTDVK